MSDTTENPIRDAISEAIGEHEVILFMKGTPEQPMCGFSARTAAALEALGDYLRAEVVAAAGEVLDLRPGARQRALDAVLELGRAWHRFRKDSGARLARIEVRWSSSPT